MSIEKFILALKAAEGTDLIIVTGAEITRDMPPGHASDIFVEDVNKLLLDYPIEVLSEASNQGAFIFRNHPNRTAQKKDGIAEVTELHEQLIAEGLIHGIEVVNEHTYSDEALRVQIKIQGTERLCNTK